MTQVEINAALRSQGKVDAEALQIAAPGMSGTELNGAALKIPLFTEACKVKNMLDRPVGFVCLSSARRVVKLLQVYDSDVFTQEPEMLPAQWGFAWSTNPAHARPFISLSTSPYNVDEVCSWGLDVYASTIPNNVWSPEAHPQGWRWIGDVRSYQ